MAPVIPGIAVLSDKRYKELLDEVLIKTHIVIRQLDKLMQEAMGDDKKLANQAFMKLGNIVGSIQKVANEKD